MRKHAKPAIVAELSEAESLRIRIALESLGYAPVFQTDDGIDALHLVVDKLPEVILISAALRPSDGIWLARAILAQPLRMRPSIILTRVHGLQIPGETGLIESGVAVCDRPLTLDALEHALAETDIRVRRLPKWFILKRDELLDQLGVPDHEGRKYLACAVNLVYQDLRLMRTLTGTLYPMVGELFGVSGQKVEHSMRYAIELAWKHGQIDEQYRIFRGTIDAQRGKPTCGEMIAQLADILRIEEVRG